MGDSSKTNIKRAQSKQSSDHAVDLAYDFGGAIIFSFPLLMTIITMHVDATLQTRNGYLVKFRAVNEGGSTAEGLTLEGVLRNGADILETSNTVLEWVPAHSEREGGLFFTLDPRQYQLQLRAKGYENP